MAKKQIKNSKTKTEHPKKTYKRAKLHNAMKSAMGGKLPEKNYPEAKKKKD